MFTEKMEQIKALIAKVGAEITDKTEELKSALNTEDLEKARAIRKDIDALKSQKEEAENDLKSYELAEAGNAESEAGKAHKVKAETKSYREAVNEYIRTKGAKADAQLKLEGKDLLIPMNVAVDPTTDGLKKAGTEKVTSKEIVTTPMREVKTVVDLKQFTTIHLSLIHI